MKAVTVRLLLTIEIPGYKPRLIERWLTTKTGIGLDGKPMIAFDTFPERASECELEVDVLLLPEETDEAPHTPLQVDISHVALDGKRVSWSSDSRLQPKSAKLNQLELWLVESESRS